MITITREMFEKYDALLKSGTPNMACGSVQARSGLSPDEYREILCNYSAYSKQFAEPAPKPKRKRSKPKPKPVLEAAPEPESEPLTDQQVAVGSGLVV